MNALLWKESWEILNKVLIGLGVCLFIGALRMHEGFNWEFSDEVDEFSIWFGLIAGGVLGMDLVSAERGKGTLGFLLGRPLTRMRLLGAKFIVGVAGLSILLVAWWIMVYATSLAANPQDPWDVRPISVANRLLEEIGLGTMLIIWLPLWLLPFAAAFFGSSLSDNPLKSLLMGCVSLIVMGGGLYAISEHNGTFSYFIKHLVDTHLGYPVRILRVAMDGDLLALRLGFALVVCLGASVGALAAVKRFRVSSLGWKQTAVACIVGTALTWTGALALSSRSETQHPLASVPFPGSIRSVAVAGGYVYMAGDGLMTVVDLSDPDAISEVGQSAKRPLWTTHGMAVRGDRAYQLGTEKAIPVDSLAVAVFDVGNKASPLYIGRYVLGPAPPKQAVGDFVVASGTRLSAVLSETGEAFSLLTIGLDEKGYPNQHSEWEILRPEYASDDRHERWSNWPQKQVLGDIVLFTGRHGLTVARTDNPLAPVKIADVSMEPFSAWSMKRHSEVDGNRLYVQTFWPAEVAVFDITDPTKPVKVGSILTRIGGSSAIVDNHLLINSGPGEFIVSRLDADTGTATRVAHLQPSDRISDHKSFPVWVEDGLVVTASSNHLRVYPVVW